MARERVPKHIRQIIPHSIPRERVREIHLRTSVIQPVLAAGDLERNPTRRRVVVQLLAVAVAGLDGLFGSDGAANGPEVDGVLAVVDYIGGADGGDEGEAETNEGEDLDLHVVVDSWK